MLSDTSSNKSLHYNIVALYEYITFKTLCFMDAVFKYLLTNPIVSVK